MLFRSQGRSAPALGRAPGDAHDPSREQTRGPTREHAPERCAHQPAPRPRFFSGDLAEHGSAPHRSAGHVPSGERCSWSFRVGARSAARALRGAHCGGAHASSFDAGSVHPHGVRASTFDAGSVHGTGSVPNSRPSFFGTHGVRRVDTRPAT